MHIYQSSALLHLSMSASGNDIFYPEYPYLTCSICSNTERKFTYYMRKISKYNIKIKKYILVSYYANYFRETIKKECTAQITYYLMKMYKLP